MRRMITNRELSEEVAKQIDTAGAVNITGAQTITGAKTFTDLAGYFTNGLTIKNSTSGATKRLVVEPFYIPSDGDTELEVGWMYLIVPWSAADIGFKMTDTTAGDVTANTDTSFGLGFVYVFGYAYGTQAAIALQSSYTDADTGKPLVLNYVATDSTKVYITIGDGRANWGLRIKWVD